MKAMFALGLSEAAEKIARGEITSEALTASCIRRIAAVEPPSTGMVIPVM